MLKYVADHTCDVCTAGCLTGGSSVLPQPHSNTRHSLWAHLLCQYNSSQLVQCSSAKQFRNSVLDLYVHIIDVHVSTGVVSKYIVLTTSSNYIYH